MRIEKNCFLQGIRIHELGIIQVPTLAFLYVPTEFQEFPDSFFLEVRDARLPSARLAFGKEDSFLFLSKLGTICLFDKIFEHIEKLKMEYLEYDKTDEFKNRFGYEDYTKEQEKNLAEIKLMTREYCLEKILKEIDKVEQKTIKHFIKNQSKFLNKIYKKPE